MIIFLRNKRRRLFLKIQSLMVCSSFVFSLVFPSLNSYAQTSLQTALGLPMQENMISLTSGYTPAFVRGLKIYPDNPLRFDFIVDTGNTNLKEKEFEQEAHSGLYILEQNRRKQGASGQSSQDDQATLGQTPVGGIDLNPAALDLQIRRDGNGIPLPLFEQPIKNMNIKGFYPVIIDVRPINVPDLLGVNTKNKKAKELGFKKGIDLFESKERFIITLESPKWFLR